MSKDELTPSKTLNLDELTPSRARSQDEFPPDKTRETQLRSSSNQFRSRSSQIQNILADRNQNLLMTS